MLLFSFLLCLIHDYFDSFSYFKFFSVPSSSSFILRMLINHHNRCSSTKLPGSTDQFPFESTWPFSSIRDKENGTTWLQWEGENSTLTDGWRDSYAFPLGWIIKILLAEETLNIFLLTGISNINMFFIKKNMNVIVYSNIHDKFAFTNLSWNLKKNFKKTNFKIDIIHFSVFKTKWYIFNSYWFFLVFFNMSRTWLFY